MQKLFEGRTPKTIVTSLSSAALSAMAVSNLDIDIQVPWDSKDKDGNPHLIHFRDQGSQATLPGMPTGIQYQKVTYLSTAPDTMGELMAGTSIVVKGFQIQTDPSGSPQTEETPEGQKYLLVTKDAEGNDLEPQTLMQWRVMFGRDRNRRGQQQPRNTPLLTIVPFSGVPVKGQSEELKESISEEDMKKIAGNVDWDQNPGLQQILEKPIKVFSYLAKESPENEEHKLWLEYIAAIPIIEPKEAETPAFRGGNTQKLSDAVSDAIPEENPFKPSE